MSSDYTYVSITSTGTNTFTATVANSGGSTGAAGAYIPAVKATVTGTSSVTAVTLASPTKGDIRINNYLQHSSAQEDPTTLTLPTSVTNGVGFANKQTMFPASATGMIQDGTGASGGLVPTLSYTLGASLNVISISAIDSEVETQVHLQF
jgi:hypothetical protein